MEKKILQFVFFIIALTFSANLRAEINPGDSLKASLLTCSPGTEIYEYYGHTALRIHDMTSGDDYVFNYGLFDYSAPHFVWRFVRGETDYKVGACLFEDFLPEYRRRGSYVQEDILNLTQKEAFKLFTSLADNCRQEKCTYHYDFFYDNCATRIRDQIEKCIEGKLIFTTPVDSISLRSIVHEYSAKYKWSLFGQDLLIGSEADRKVDRRIQQFAPLYLERDLHTALINGKDGSVRTLMSGTRMLVPEGTLKEKKGFPLSPMKCCIILVIITIGVTVWDFIKKKVTWIFDAVLLGLQGLAGCLITFMFFFSLHPTVDTNWLILLFNPLPLVFLYHTIKAEKNKKESLYHNIARLYLFVFICAVYFVPQYISSEVSLLALCLLVRSMSYHMMCRLWWKKQEGE